MPYKCNRLASLDDPVVLTKAAFILKKLHIFSPSRLRRASALATARANPDSSERIIARADP